MSLTDAAAARHLKSIATALWALVWTWWATIAVSIGLSLLFMAAAAGEMRRAEEAVRRAEAAARR